MGATRNLVLGRCAALLFLCGAVASLPTNVLLGASPSAYLANVLALVSAVVTFLIPWQHLHRRWLHVLAAVASVEVCVAVVVHGKYATVFMWYFVLVCVFSAYAFRRRREAAAQLLFAVAGMVATAAYANPLDPDALANAVVAIPTVCVAGGIVVWLRENLERRERTDPLTGLSNRRALMEMLDETIAWEEPRLLALFDLDGFKRYNDRLGHAAGDELLQRVGARLLAAVADHGEAFRLGGDELCVLLDDAGVLEACVTALRDDGITASHGTCRLPDEASTSSAALSLADTRMYEAKRSARDVPFVLAMESPSETPGPAAPTPSDRRSGSRSPQADRSPGPILASDRRRA